MLIVVDVFLVLLAILSISSLVPRGPLVPRPRGPPTWPGYKATASHTQENSSGALCPVWGLTALSNGSLQAQK